MLDKSHCRFDPFAPSSEYADFYAQPSQAGDHHDDNDDGRQLARADGTFTLSSGKILASRSAPPPRPPRLTRSQKQEAPAESGPTTATTTDDDDDHVSTTGALTKAERREVALSSRMAALSVSDRHAIAHLPASEQRATMQRRDRALQRARRADRRMASRVEVMGNKTLMQHYRASGTERPNG
ncbi:unnamed protein product [Parascedosporium putredinis]|uniref:Uncharacterized protein n=1 Tax=Parascedosporium putredinis TaxID=1442378 RepID=A0A9P1H3I1_9PEZI|nr:unnamed protein product [Parascedosporium putredinis]CAI7994750.1 unnamed protein product [Parascedosporium putredinis]